ncbi:hypothetical protein KTT_43050 [Tengunoibacter tsumagoiensis]|uniref:N-acetyltransferase domain-containing protein n=2 Tax=Tengunoibacter tsumagoiensis TaxID=2014871 RepID=A0A402A5Y4_9CHLR|nr:hypothetical protein KTT_43050 [Tengunoibacter tsumagoiensis]
MWGSSAADRQAGNHWLRALFVLPRNRYSYQHILVAEQEQQITGLILSFAGKDEDEINRTTERQVVEHLHRSAFSLVRESAPDEWCIEALAVEPDWTHQGIGTQLLQAAEQLAMKENYTKASLRVEDENQPALSLYHRLGYQTLKEVTHYGHHYLYLQKQLVPVPEA